MGPNKKIVELRVRFPGEDMLSLQHSQSIERGLAGIVMKEDKINSSFC